MNIFGEMQWKGMKPSVVTVVSVLSMCASLSSLQQGKHIYSYVIRNGLESNVFVGNALIGYVNSTSMLLFFWHVLFLFLYNWIFRQSCLPVSHV